MVDRLEKVGAQQLGQLSRVNPVTLVAFFQQGIPSWIAHHVCRDVRLQQVVKLGGPSSSSKVKCKYPRSPWINCKMVIAFVSMMDSITIFP
jgi:hypothetical protein